MRVLVVTEIKPHGSNIGGGQIRFKYMNRILGQIATPHTVFLSRSTTADDSVFEGFRGTYVTYKLPKPNNIVLRAVNALFQFVHLKRETRSFLSEIVAAFNPDLVWIEYGFTGQFVRFFQKLGLPVIYDTQNVETVLFREIIRHKKLGISKLVLYSLLAMYYLNEKYLIPKSNAILVTSDADKDICLEMGYPADRIHVVPNVVDENDYLSFTDPLSIDYQFCLFPGTFDNFQNMEGLQFFTRFIWPDILNLCPELHLIVAGRSANSVAKLVPGISILDRLHIVDFPISMVPYFKMAKFTVIPILTGGGTRVKAIESLMCGTPVIGTSKGLEGLNLVNGVTAVIADTPEDFSKDIRRLCSDPQFCRKLGEAGRMHALDNFSIKVAKNKITDIVRQLVKEPF